VHSTIEDGYQTWYRNKQHTKGGRKKQNKELGKVRKEDKQAKKKENIDERSKENKTRQK
jgi:hypothetical protein